MKNLRNVVESSLSISSVDEATKFATNVNNAFENDKNNIYEVSVKTPTPSEEIFDNSDDDDLFENPEAAAAAKATAAAEAAAAAKATAAGNTAGNNQM
jgi:hypothetical protein